MAVRQTPIPVAFPPGDFIREELAARKMTQQELALKMERPYPAVNAIINGRKAITARTALELGDAFGTSAVYWLNLESGYQLYKESQKRKVDYVTVEQTGAHKAARVRRAIPKPDLLGFVLPGARVASKAGLAPKKKTRR